MCQEQCHKILIFLDFKPAFDSALKPIINQTTRTQQTPSYFLLPSPQELDCAKLASF